MSISLLVKSSSQASQLSGHSQRPSRSKAELHLARAQRAPVLLLDPSPLLAQVLLLRWRPLVGTLHVRVGATPRTAPQVSGRSSFRSSTTFLSPSAVPSVQSFQLRMRTAEPCPASFPIVVAMMGAGLQHSSTN